MDWFVFWDALESLSNYFYEPLLFWGLPFALAIVYENLLSKPGL